MKHRFIHTIKGLLGFLVIFGLMACNQPNTESLVLSFQNQIEVTLPSNTSKIIELEGVSVVVAGDQKLVFRLVDEEELKFIGANQSAYEFFSQAFSAPETEQQKAFISGLGEINNQASGSSESVTIQHNYLADNIKSYLFSPDLVFALEVTTPKEMQAYTQILDKSALKGR